MDKRYSDGLRAEEVIDLYYKQLNADTDFRAALADLFQHLAESATRFVELRERTGFNSRFRKPYPFQPEKQLTRVPYASQLELYNEIGQALSAFCERWHLPINYGLDDVWNCLWLHSLMSDGEPEFYAVMRQRSYPVVGIPFVIDVVESGNDRIPVVMKLPYIYPNAPVRFMYDPIEQSRAWLNQRIDAICDNVRQSILSQAAVFESQAAAEGWGKRPPRHTPSYLQQIARALYLRAVKCMKWDDVASECEVYSPDDFARRVRFFAAQCGIPLPES